MRCECIDSKDRPGSYQKIQRKTGSNNSTNNSKQLSRPHLNSSKRLCISHRGSVFKLSAALALVILLNMLSIVKPWMLYKAPHGLLGGHLKLGRDSARLIVPVIGRSLRSSTPTVGDREPRRSAARSKGNEESDSTATAKKKPPRAYNMGPNGDVYKKAMAAGSENEYSSKAADKIQQIKKAVNSEAKDISESRRPSTRTKREVDIQRAAESLTPRVKATRDSTTRKVAPSRMSSRSGTDGSSSSNRFSKIPAISEPQALITTSNSGFSSSPIAVVKNRPFTIPSGQFRPKQSLGQNFLSDQNYVNKIVDAFSDDSPNGCRVVELGCGPGALTRLLYKRYPEMTGFEIDRRAIEFLSAKLPGINLVHKDVLQINWAELALSKNGPLSVIGNLPYYITSQILFSLLDNYRAIDKAVFTSQKEVAERIVAAPRTKAYGILSVAFQLYASNTVTGSRTDSKFASSMSAARRAEMLKFIIPSSVFFPQPKVDSALVHLDFTRPHKDLHRVSLLQLRRILLTSFQQRRKMLRQSLKDMLYKEGLDLPEKYQTKRPEELSPEEFLELTADLFGEIALDAEGAAEGGSLRRNVAVIDIPDASSSSSSSSYGSTSASSGDDHFSSDTATSSPHSIRSYDPLVVWRRRMVPHELNTTSTSGLESVLGDGLGGKRFRKLQ